MCLLVRLELVAILTDWFFTFDIKIVHGSLKLFFKKNHQPSFMILVLLLIMMHNFDSPRSCKYGHNTGYDHSSSHKPGHSPWLLVTLLIS
jgi:hypothetical protein